MVEQDKEAEKARKSEERHAKKEEARLAKEKRKSGRYEPEVTEPSVTGAATGATTESVFETEERETAQPIQFAEEPVPIEPVAGKPVVSRPIAAEPIPATGPSTGPWALGEKPPRAAPRPPVTPEPTPIRTSMEDEASLRMRQNAAMANGEKLPSPDGKVKKWLKNRFSRRLSRGGERPVVEPEERADEKTGGFVGGATLAGAGALRSTESLERPSSARNVALAGKASEEEPIEEPAADEAVVVGPSDHCIFEDDIRRSARKSASPTDEEYNEARDRFDENLATPPTFPVAKEASPIRDSRFIEQI